MSTVNIADLLTSLSGASGDEKAFREAVVEWTGSPDSKKKSRKSKKSDDAPKKARAPTAWNAWIEARCGKKGSETQEFLDWKEAQGEMKGNVRMVYAKHCKEDDAAGYETFATTFKSSASSAASAATHDSDDEAPEPVAELEAKPKKAATKAKKTSAKSDSSDVEAAPVIEAKPAKKSAAKPKKPAKKPVESDSESE